MSVRKLFIIGVSALLICALWGGCSKDDTANLGSRSSTSASGAGMYFPLNEGYSTTYTVKYAGGSQETVRYEAGREVDFGDGQAIEWHSFASNGAVNTSYFRASESAIDHYSDLSESPQRILELPFEFGHTWTAQVSGDDSFGDTFDSLAANTDPDDKGGADTTDNNDNNGEPLFSYPALGSVYLTVDGFEGLQMSNGTYYSSALKVSSSNQHGDESYFWYVAGVGLAKYVIDATGADYPEGRIVGELVQYGFN